MKGDLVICDGKPVRPGEIGLSPDYMSAANFVYQKMHVSAHKPLHAAVHAELLGTAYSTLYGGRCGITAALLEKEVALLSEVNRYPAGSGQVAVYVFPAEHGGEPVRILSCEKLLLYKGYTLWHKAENAIVLPYEYPFPHFKTAVSLAANTYAAAYAARKNAGCAIAETREGVLYGVGENPLFAVAENTVFTTPVGDGACDSVERRLGIAAAEMSGFEVTEIPVAHAQLGEFRELFAVTTAGTTSIRECEGHIYSHSTAGKIAEQMRTITGGML